MTIVIYHNPSCGTSRKTLEAIRATGREPVVIEYLKAGWTRAHLLGLFAAAGLSPREALRTKQALAGELGLTDEEVGDDRIIEAMVDNPVLVERPFVCAPRGVRLCRPMERLYDLIDPS